MMSEAHQSIMAEDAARLLARPLPWERLSGRTVLITGATGLVAGYLCEVLLLRNRLMGDEPTKVTALVRDLSKAQRRFGAYAKSAGVEFILQDMTAPLARLPRFDLLVHAAGNASPRRFASDPVGTYAATVLGTHELLAHAERTGTQGFLFLSSGAVHGAVPGSTTVIDERTMGIVDPLDAYACYAESRRMAETMCAAWTRQHGLPTRIARLGHSYGPGLQRADDRAFAEFVYSVLDGRDIVLRSDGRAVRPYCYLADVTDALLRILLMGEDGDAYLVAYPEASCSIVELATFLASADPARPVAVHTASVASTTDVVNRDPQRALDISKLRELGWQPRIGYEEGFRRTLRSLG